MRSDSGPPQEGPSRRKRGRPPHPDILTPREWQVLDLLRQGLTNEQIAHRLDISPATAKYHVSEIISKLCVTAN
jgi:DNA-binding NarL/FixJ family response regulator